MEDGQVDVGRKNRKVDELTREVNVRQKPLDLERLEEFLDGNLLLDGFL